MYKLKILLCILILFVCVPCFAESKWSIGTRVSILDFDDDNCTKLQPLYGLNLSYQVNKYFTLEAEVASGKYFSNGNDWSDGSDWREFIATLNFQLHYPLNKRLSPYLVYGVGKSFFWQKQIAFNESLPASSSIALKYGGGFDWSVNKDISLNGEVSYHYANTGRISSLDTWGWVYSVGVKYQF